MIIIISRCSTELLAGPGSKSWAFCPAEGTSSPERWRSQLLVWFSDVEWIAFHTGRLKWIVIVCYAVVLETLLWDCTLIVRYFGFNIQHLEGSNKESIRYSTRKNFSLFWQTSDCWTFLLTLIHTQKRGGLGMFTLDLLKNTTHISHDVWCHVGFL